MRCPCRKKSETTSYADCCQPYHAGTAAAPTAETLMRSRYAAYALKNAEYLRATWQPSTGADQIDFLPDQEWLSLRILASREIGDAATVEFVARSRIAGRSYVLHETSRFVRQTGRWLYVDGAIA